jgi:hypothetical protein
MAFSNPHPTPRSPPRRVLEDASGRRLQRMRWVGRAIALLFLIWLALVILGGLGVGPVARLPLGNVLRASSGPPPLRHVPRPAQPAPADLVPALPAPVPAGGTATKTPAAAKTPAARTASPGKSAVAPGHTRSTRTTTTPYPGRSGVAPGHTSTLPARGKSTTAPGQVRRTTTTTTATTTVATVPGKKLGHGKKP